MIDQARVILGNLLAVAVGELATVHLYSPRTVLPPAITIGWGSPLLEPRTSTRTHVNLVARLTVATAAGLPAQQLVDDLLGACLLELIDSDRVLVDTVEQPREDPETGTYTAALAVTVPVERTAP